MTRLVRAGNPDALLPPERGTLRAQHVAANVYGEMLLTICSEYRVLPDPRSLTQTEIRFFYNGLRGRLVERTKPRK